MDWRMRAGGTSCAHLRTPSGRAACNVAVGEWGREAADEDRRCRSCMRVTADDAAQLGRDAFDRGVTDGMRCAATGAS